MNNYKYFNEQLKGRCRNSRKLTHNTYLKRVGEDIAVRLHGTDVVTYKPDGTVILNSGGWKTPTTKDRINNYSPVRIWQEKGQWFVSQPDRCCIFRDRMEIDSDGIVKKPIYKDRTTDRLIREINAYCKKLKELDKLPEPSGGDCWHCLHFDSGNGAGVPSKSKEHLISHLRSKYIHGSIIMRALIWKGYRDPVLIWQMNFRNDIVQAVRGYMKANLGIAR